MDIISTIMDTLPTALRAVEDVVNHNINVWRASDNLNLINAAYEDKSLVPASPGGSNAYGSLTHFNQVGFFVMLVTPDEESAEQIDKLLTCCGTTRNEGEYITKHHRNFDYVQGLMPKIESDLSVRPNYARNFMIDILQSGVYLWYYNSGISPYFGSPYGVDNPEV